MLIMLLVMLLLMLVMLPAENLLAIYSSALYRNHLPCEFRGGMLEFPIEFSD